MISGGAAPLTYITEDFVKTTCLATAVAIGFLFISGTPAAYAQQAKPAIRGLVSMGAFKFVGSGGDTD